jgi:elongator complex protein 3
MADKYQFDVQKYQAEMLAIFAELEKGIGLLKILKHHPRDGKGVFSRDQLVAGYRYLVENHTIAESQLLLDKLKMKPTRTISGVVPVTVLTKPFPCPGQCIFCPDDVRMPKSYLANEPGAQRAERNLFDPYLQVYNRLLAFRNIGHGTDKVELIVLGGTWSYYPLAYRIWFIKRCFQAMNDFPAVDQRENRELEQVATWDELRALQEINENAQSRNVGLVLETRPDYIDQEEIVILRKLGATKIQIGIQSLDDNILDANQRGHTLEQTIQAIELLRNAGFKIHAHWMPNLYLASVEKDKQDYLKLWQLAMPDELKIYPTSIIKGTKLADLFEQGLYKPYDFDELVDVLRFAFLNTPRYCRLTRVVRDIPAPDIVAGNKFSNLRQIVENQLLKDGEKCQCIRCREIRGKIVAEEDLELESLDYQTPSSHEYFLSFKTKVNDKLVAFLRLSLPKNQANLIPELSNSAIIREVHVYGQVVDIGSKEEGKAQHLGLGTKLITKAKQISKENGYNNIAVIAAIGTRQYYRKQGFSSRELYMHHPL